MTELANYVIEVLAKFVMSTRKLCIYTDYMVAFENSAWMYYI
jgi:hypothetical protein